jgi:Double zinc ribbon
MPILAYFGIHSSGLNLAIDLLILFLVVLYVSLVYWTYMDAKRRIVDPIMIGCATLASLFPYVGTVVYIILRPPEYLEDVRERELEMQAAEVRLATLEQSLCPHCDYHVERDFLRCPSCMRKLKEPCQSCGKPLERTWSLCPYCEAEVEARPPASQGRRAGRKRGESSSARAPGGRAGIDSEAQTGESEALLGEETLATSAGSSGSGAGASAGGAGDRKRTAVPAKPSPTAGTTPRASRPRPSS